MPKTPKFPILLVHGMGFRDYKSIGYWGRIPKRLSELGCKIYFGHQDSNGDVETNGRVLKETVEKIILECGCDKVNVIAHSKGGLDTRYAISVLGIGDKVASLTTVATPHHGSKTVDKLLKLPKVFFKIGCFFADLWCRMLGDRTPATYKVIRSFSTASAEEFNRLVTDDPRVYYQSYAFVMKRPTSDILMWLPNAIVAGIEGENDGLLTPDSVKWGEFKGIFRGNTNRGISHCDEIDLRRTPLTKRRGEGVSDITDVYADIVNELCERGF